MISLPDFDRFPTESDLDYSNSSIVAQDLTDRTEKFKEYNDFDER